MVTRAKLSLATLAIVLFFLSPRALSADWTRNEDSAHETEWFDLNCCAHGENLLDIGWARNGKLVYWVTISSTDKKVATLDIASREKQEYHFGSDTKVAFDQESHRLFSSKTDSKTSVLVVTDLDDHTTSELENSTESDATLYFPSLSPNGSSILYVSNPRNISQPKSLIVQDLTSPDKQRILQKAGNFQWPKWFPDQGAIVYFSEQPPSWLADLFSRRPTYELKIVFLNDKRPEVRIDTTTFHIDSFWAYSFPISKVIYRRYGTRQYSSSEIWEYNVESKKRVRLLRFQDIFGHEHEAHRMSASSGADVRLTAEVLSGDLRLQGVWLFSLGESLAERIYDADTLDSALNPEGNAVALVRTDGTIGVVHAGED